MHGKSCTWAPRAGTLSVEIGLCGLLVILSLVFSGIGWSQSVSGLIEPGAGAWKTWVLSSGSELRIPAPPGWLQTSTEIELLKMLSLRRDQATLDRIKESIFKS